MCFILHSRTSCKVTWFSFYFFFLPDYNSIIMYVVIARFFFLKKRITFILCESVQCMTWECMITEYLIKEDRWIKIIEKWMQAFQSIGDCDSRNNRILFPLLIGACTWFLSSYSMSLLMLICMAMTKISYFKFVSEFKGFSFLILNLL